MVSISHLPYLCLALRPHLCVAPVLYFGNCNIAPQADPPFLHSLLLCPRRNSLCEKCPENRHWHCSKSRPNLMNRRWERWKRTVSVKKDVHELPVQWALTYKHTVQREIWNWSQPFVRRTPLIRTLVNQTFGGTVLHRENVSSHMTANTIWKGKKLYYSTKNITHSKQQKFICFLRPQDSSILHRAVSLSILIILFHLDLNFVFAVQRGLMWHLVT